MARGHRSEQSPDVVPAPTEPGEDTVAASTMDAGWEPVLASIVDSFWPEFRTRTSPRNLASFLLNGTTTLEWKRRGRLTRYLSEPGSLAIIPAGGDHQFRTERPARWLHWEIEP